MIPFPEKMLLENERVLLRPLEHGDIEYLMPFAENEPELWTYSMVSAAGKTGMTNYLAQTLHEKGLKKEFPLIIFDKLNHAYAGCTRFYDVQPVYSTTQLGYTWYGRKFQRTGLNRNCKLLMLTYAFEVWEMERVEFRADNRNTRSIQAMKDIGCTVEGVLRSNTPLATGGRRDSIILSILKQEWFDHVKKNLQEKIR